MENNNENEKENKERRNSNTEYVPTKCRVTKPPPPKPATNPLQFIKVAPCPLFQKAQEQIKKVEEIKKERKEIREEAEDWQQNLDNWKSSRRKRQEHIIERVVEVKKLEQEEQERCRRKSKTFSEMIEDRSRGRHKFNIPIYDDDSNDLSDYGIGSSSSKTNSIKDVDTDDSCSILDEKEHNSYDSPSNKDNSSTSNQSQSEDETNIKKDNVRMTTTMSSYSSTNLYINNNNNNNNNNNCQPNVLTKSKSLLDSKLFNEKSDINISTTEQYTYEGAIQDYRSRIRSKIHVDESIFTKNQQDFKSKEYSEAQNALPKGEIFKRKELFEIDKPIELNQYETVTSKRLSEDFANSQSIKQRLKSLERCTDQSIKNNDKNDVQTVLVKQRLQNFNNKQNEIDNSKNNNNNNNNKLRPNKISNYLVEKSNNNNNNSSSFETKNNTTNNNNENFDRCSSPETELYMNKLNMFNRDLDNLMFGKTNNNIDDYCVNNNLNYPPSTSSMDLMGISSDREDSGIHTADVSCSVSQADEPVEDNELVSNTIPNCIEKLSKEEKNNNQTNIETLNQKQSNKDIINCTKELLESLRKDSSNNLFNRIEELKMNNKQLKEIIEPTKIVTYENIELKSIFTPVDFINGDILVDGTFPLTPSTLIEPPKDKPPPPPPSSIDNDNNCELPETTIKRLNSTKRIKKEIHIKRSSFLGLDEPTDEQIYPEIPVDKPPDINTFLQKESKLEKSLYKKLQEENRIGMLSKVESQDSGLDIDRGRLSSDTWCSSIGGDSSTPSHERQDSEQTNSITSEEDEITKKEREIIEMVEKEEKSRDSVEFTTTTTTNNLTNNHLQNNDKYFNSNCKLSPNYLDDQDSEVLKVEHELRQLEREELERQRENMLFQESRVKARLQNNRHSLENICDEIYPSNYQQEGVDYRKSMPELQHIPLEYRKSLPDVPNAMYNNNNNNINYNNKPIPELDVQYRKSMPDIQHAYHKLIPDYRKIDNSTSDNKMNLNHRKSLPELQRDIQKSAFKIPTNRQPIMPGKPLRPPTKEQKERFFIINSNDTKPRQLTRHSLQALSAVPKSRPVPNDNWIQPRANPEIKSYNQHWLFQEAELRRISDQQKNAATSNVRNWQQPRQEKHLPDSVIQSLTQRVQNRCSNVVERNQAIRRNDGSPSKDYVQQNPYINTQTMGHALPIPYLSPASLEESQDRMLSVSGKKKCSYCNNELGRGAAMIIESLCLFYHMECFKCCVCHMQLGDGLMGTDVRVRNQKLHCHNCYSSDDGVKFSCV